MFINIYYKFSIYVELDSKHFMLCTRSWVFILFLWFIVLPITFYFNDVGFVWTTFILNLLPVHEILSVILLSNSKFDLYYFCFLYLLLEYFICLLACPILVFYWIFLENHYAALFFYVIWFFDTFRFVETQF